MINLFSIVTLLQLALQLLSNSSSAQNSSTQAMAKMAMGYATQALASQRTTIQLPILAPSNVQSQSPILTLTAHITANGSEDSITVPYNTAVTINWKSANANFCNVSPLGWLVTSVSQKIDNLIASNIYTVSCSRAGSAASASVTVNVSPPLPSSTRSSVSTVTNRVPITIVNLVSPPGLPL